MAGYPNMFLLYGPNTNLGAGSIIVMLEAQIRYVARALELIGDGRALDVRPDVQRRYVDDVQRRLRDTVWTGCDSWYRQDGDGRIVNNWPGFVAEYIRDTRAGRRPRLHGVTRVRNELLSRQVGASARLRARVGRYRPRQDEKRRTDVGDPGAGPAGW